MHDGCASVLLNFLTPGPFVGHLKTSVRQYEIEVEALRAREL